MRTSTIKRHHTLSKKEREEGLLGSNTRKGKVGEAEGLEVEDMGRVTQHKVTLVAQTSTTTSGLIFLTRPRTEKSEEGADQGSEEAEVVEADGMVSNQPMATMASKSKRGDSRNSMKSLRRMLKMMMI